MKNTIVEFIETDCIIIVLNSFTNFCVFTNDLVQRVANVLLHKQLLGEMQ